MRTILFLILVVISGTVFADIPPMQFPTPLHRIGVEVFAEVVGAIAVGGLVLRQMLAKYGKTKEVDEQEVWNTQRNSADGSAITIGFGGEYVRDAKGGAACWNPYYGVVDVKGGWCACQGVFYGGGFNLLMGVLLNTRSARKWAK